MTKINDQKTSRQPRRPPALPDELFAPIEWRPDELEHLRVRVRELMTRGHPRSEASTVAFGELVTRRALERARDDAHRPPEPPELAS